MVQAQENWADVECVVKHVAPDPSRPGWIMASVELANASSVEGYRNMLEPSVGTEITLGIREEQAAKLDLRPGITIEARARLAAPRLAFVGSTAPLREKRPPGGSPDARGSF